MKRYITISAVLIIAASCSQMDELAPQGGSALASQVLETNQAVPSRVNATFNGMYMLLYQGAEAFKIWTGQEMPVDLVKKQLFS